MRILVTGHVGFIGSHFCKYVLETEPDAFVVGFSRNSDQRNMRRLSMFYGQGHPRFKNVWGDLTDSSAMSGLCEGIDVVVHFAAKTHVDHAIKDAYPFLMSNVVGTYFILEEARRQGVKRFVFISTDEVMGQILTGSHDEQAPHRPRNFYAAAKGAGEDFAIAYWHTHRFPTIITRTENNFGAFQHRQKALPTFVRHAIDNKPLPVYGDGLHVRCWLHATEHCRAVWHLCKKSFERPDKILGEVFHIAGKEEMTNIELARTVLRTLGKPEDMIEFLPDHNIRPGHDRRYALNCDKLESTGFKITQDLPTLLDETIRWYAENPEWTR